MLCLSLQQGKIEKVNELAMLNQPSITLLCEAIDYITSVKFPELTARKNTSEISISPQPLRVLNALANTDCDIKRVAANLNITYDCAMKHIGSAKKSFGTRTNYGAIRAAVKSGLIQYD